jgi:hypothetical protein
MSADPQHPPQQFQPSAPRSGEILICGVACFGLAGLSIIVGEAFRSPGEPSPLVTCFAPAMTMVGGLAAATYRVVRGLEKRLARLESRQAESTKPDKFLGDTA